MARSTLCESDLQPSSGNIFADLNIPNPDQYLAKAELAARILAIVQRRRLSQTSTGTLLGITQPKVSALLHGRLDGFSTERLFRFLNALGCDVRITVSRPRSKSPGRVEVVKAVARTHYGNGLKRTLQESDSRIQALLNRSRRSIKEGKGLSEKEFWASVAKRSQTRRKGKARTGRDKASR